jgi:hypothetical protein
MIPAKRSASAAVLLFVSFVSAWAASEFYVSPRGDDSNPGTDKTRWRTIQHAADVATAGSTVNVRGGTYEERVTINVSTTRATDT